MTSCTTPLIVVVGPSHSIHIRRWMRDVPCPAIPCALVADAMTTCPAPDTEHWRIPVRWGPAPLRLLASSPWLAWRLWRHRVSVLHLQSLGRGLLLTPLVRGRDLVVSPWGSEILASSDRGVVPYLRRWTLCRARLVLTTSADMARIVNTHYGVPKNRIRTVSWGVNTDLFRPSSNREERAEARRGWSLPEVGMMVLSPRGVAPQYRTLEIVRAFASGSRDPDDRLVILRGWTPQNSAADIQILGAT